MASRVTEEERKREAIDAAGTCVKVLKEQFGAREAYVAGSLAGHAPWHGRSDLDIAVLGLSPDKYFSALSRLTDLLPEGLELDLITMEDAPPGLVSRILGETKMPDDPKKALELEISEELLYLERLADQSRVLLGSPSEPTFIESSAAGKVLHDFYCGVERIFERIAVRLGPGLPAREGWHTSLLRSMETEAAGFRPAVIPHKLAAELVEYLRFRHLFRHTYGYELEWSKLKGLLERLPAVLSELRGHLGAFLRAL